MYYSKKNYVIDFDSMLNYTDIPFYSSPSYKIFKPLLSDIISNEYKSKTKKHDQKYFLNSLDSIEKQLKNKKIKNISFWIQEVSNLKAHCINAWGDKSYNIRDKQMGNNLIWLIQSKYPNKKIIVWAHNYHIGKVVDIKNWKVTAGNEVFKAFEKDTYILGFNSFSGKAGRITAGNKSYNIKIPKKECFEIWVKEKEFEYAFIDFNSIANQSSLFKMKGTSHSMEKSNWMEIYDGVFYIEKMYKCDKIE